MTICREHEMSFWMDIHGELGLEDRRVWERHLALCDACREEKVLAHRMMGCVKEALSPPALSDAALNAVVDRIAERSRKQPAPRRAPKHPWFVPGVVFPSVVTACLLLIAIGFIGLKAFTPDAGQPGIPVANLKEALQKDDIEVIENMELLEEFETIQQLVQVMEDQHTPANVDGEIHGNMGDERELLYG
jgi:hypothetical protein